MRGLQLLEPKTLPEALALVADGDEAVRPFAGGTALMLMMKAGVLKPSRLVRLGSIGAEHEAIVVTPDGGLRIGAIATLTTIEHSPDVLRLAPVIGRAMKRLANVRVRNAARVGGTLAHGDPHMDLPPILTALGGALDLTGPDGARRVALEDFYTGYYETVLRPGELIVAVDLPLQRGWASAYAKTTTRTHDDWPALGIAVSMKLAGSVIEDARIVVSAATEHAVRAGAAEAALRGQNAGDSAFARAGSAAADEVETVGDVRGSAAYKTALVRVHVRRALHAAAAQGVVA